MRSLPPAAEAARNAYRAVGHAQHLCLDAGYDYDQVHEVYGQTAGGRLARLGHLAQETGYHRTF